MVSYNNLMKDYKEKIDDLTPKEVMSLLESLIKQIYDAYNVYDIEEMERCADELDDAMEILDGRFRNIGVYVWRTKLFYESSLHQYKLRKSILHDTYHHLESYIHLYGQLESNLLYLHSILSTYYFNYGNSHIDEVMGNLYSYENISDDVVDDILENVYDNIHEDIGINYFLMVNLDDLIRDIRDDILETMNVIEERFYSPDDSQKVLDDSISNIRNHVHDLIEDDSYRYQREKGIIDVELGWINVFTIEHDLNHAYGILKKRIDEMFEGDNGFKHIHRMYYEEHLKRNPKLKFEDEEKTHPKYNIMETRFIPPESRKDNKMWEKYRWWKERC